MSKGPGAIQRALTHALDAAPDAAFRTDDLCRLVYSIEQPQKKHRVAVIRAMHGIQKRRPALGRQGSRFIWYNKESFASYIAAHKGRHYRRGATPWLDALDDIDFAAGLDNAPAELLTDPGNRPQIAGRRGIYRLR